MLFSSLTFLLYFLPFTLIIYFLLHDKVKNYFLLLASLFFYAWGEPKFVIVMLGSIIFNYFIALIIDKIKSSYSKTRVIALIICILGNISILFIFKYLSFTIRNLSRLLKIQITCPNILLPIGISFFTFQAMSYVIDVYSQKVKVQKNLFNLGLYISFFPQLIAGPIVRYSDIEDQISNRKISLNDFSKGLEIFIIGLAKKVIIANNMSIITDTAWSSLSDGSLTVFLSWLGSMAYSFQIYFDFSGYSDMAIGLGSMFGFKFPQNFNYPYMAKSITDFWRRWHISLSKWFRDYVYIPLGGNKKGIPRQIFNLFIVWLLTGIWHGANWTFILWGLCYFIFLVIEKVFKLDKISNSLLSFIYRIISLLVINFCWVLFRAPNWHLAVQYFESMFGLLKNPIFNLDNMEYLFNYVCLYFIAIIGSTGIVKRILKTKEEKIYLNSLKRFFFLFLLLYSISSLVMSTHNPFIYFNF